MKFKFWKKKIKTENKEFITLLVKYIEEAKKINLTDEEIIRRFREKNYPKDIINLSFMIHNELKGGKMAKKDYDEDEDMDEPEEEEEEPEEPRPKKPKIEIKEKQLTEEQVFNAVVDLNNRVTAIEGALFRLKSI